MKRRQYVCCICGKHCEGFGNNPFGAMCKDEEGNIVELSFTVEEECCDECNTRYVILGRIYKLTHKGK